MSQVGFIHHDIFLDHDTGHSHPENHLRLEHLYEQLRGFSFAGRLEEFNAERADESLLRLVHDPGYIQYVNKTCEANEAAALDDGDTRVCRASNEVALYAVGAAIQAVEMQHRGDMKRIFIASRPPGHHALPDHAMGFCLFNNIAIAARYAQRKLKYRRIMILDWDVHHGNGTQTVFYDDPSVFFASIHQYPFYPGTGAGNERGEGEGENYTLNIPMPEGAEMDMYRDAMKNQVIPAAEAFKPDMLLLSAGFSAHASDPLANINLRDEDFHELTQLTLEIANRHCDGKIISILEGGYHREALSRSVYQHLMALAGVEG